MCTKRKFNSEECPSSTSVISTLNNPTVETSESSNLLLQSVAASKRPRVNDEPEPVHDATKYKGVVPQQNGHWGAQIYANHHRFWLGTFKSETEAAMAYDSAAIKLRSGDSHRNFPWTVHTVQEHNFQTQFTSKAILSMIRDGSYQSKFQAFLALQSDKGKAGPCTNQNRVDRDGKFTFVQLFEKELTPSDVGKLNRLVIPKKFAVKYLPYVPEDGEGVGIGDIELALYDSRLMKSWSFRYSYWKSSQSYVFTRGWNRFVKEKKLEERDVVRFYTCTSRLGHNLCIDVRYASDHQGHGDSSECPDTRRYLAGQDGPSQEIEKSEPEQNVVCNDNDNVGKEKKFRLFGVWIEDGISHDISNQP